MKKLNWEKMNAFLSSLLKDNIITTIEENDLRIELIQKGYFTFECLNPSKAKKAKEAFIKFS